MDEKISWDLMLRISQRHMYIRVTLSRIRGVVANYLASQARDPGIESHQH